MDFKFHHYFFIKSELNKNLCLTALFEWLIIAQEVDENVVYFICNTSGFVLHFSHRLFYMLQNLMRTYGYAFLFSLTGYFGISFVLALIKNFGALLAVTGRNNIPA